MSDTADTKPRSRLPSFGRPTKITSRKRQPKRKPKDEAASPVTNFADLLRNRGRGQPTPPVTETPKPSREVPMSSRPFARVNLLSPSDRAILIELTVALRDSTDTQREINGLNPVDRSVPVEEMDAEEVSGEAAEHEDDEPENDSASAPEPASIDAHVAVGPEAVDEVLAAEPVPEPKSKPESEESPSDEPDAS